MIRGIHATLYGRLKPGVDAADLQGRLYEKRYSGEAFVDVMPAAAIPRRARCAPPTCAASQSIARRAATPWWCCR